MTYYYLAARNSRTVNIRTAPSVPIYDELVGSFGANVISYWKLAGNGIDAKGVQNAVFTGVPEEVPTIVQRDTIAEGAPDDGIAIAWSGSFDEFGEVPHNAAHKTAAGTICVTFQLDTLAEEAHIIACAASSAIGGIALKVLISGAPQVFLRDASGVVVTLVGQNGDVLLNRAYTMFLKWGPSGLTLSLWDNLTLVRRMTNAGVIDGLTANGSVIRFGSWHTDIGHHDGPVARAIWFNRFLTNAEEAILALPKTILHGQGTGEFITSPEIHGWDDLNTVLQNTASFQAAIDAASANAGTSASGRGVVELTPSKVYIVGTVNGLANAASPCLIGRSNIEIRTGNKPARATGVQAIVIFESWAAKTGINNQCLFLLQSITNVFMGWLTVDGNKATLASVTNINYGAGQNGNVSNVIVSTGVTNLIMREFVSQNSLNDGIFFTDQLSGIGPNGLLIEDCTFSRNRRAGMSANEIGLGGAPVDTCTFRRCAFVDNGDFSGDVTGQTPGSGVNITIGFVGANVDGLTFDNCTFTTNRGSQWNNGIDTGVIDPSGFGILVDSAAPVRRLRIVGSTFSGNRTNLLIQVRGDQTFNQLELVDLTSLVATINARPTFLSNGVDVGVITATTITNCNVTQIVFDTSLRNTGHSVNVWRGNFSSVVVTTNAQTTITATNGFPVTSGDILIFQSDENDPVHPLGQGHPGIFSNFGPVLVAFHPTNVTLQNAPTGGGRAYRLTIPNGDDDSVVFEFDTVARWNAGVEIPNCAIEAEFYVPSSAGSWPGLNNRGYYGVRMNGHLAHDSAAGESSAGQDTPRMQVLDRDDLSLGLEAYVYFESKTSAFGTTFGGTPATFRLRSHVDEWIHTRFEARGGHGNFTGTLRWLINGVERATNANMRYHFTPGLGWRGVAMLFYLHNRNLSGSAYSIYLKNIKMFAI